MAEHGRQTEAKDSQSEGVEQCETTHARHGHSLLRSRVALRRCKASKTPGRGLVVWLSFSCALSGSGTTLGHTIFYLIPLQHAEGIAAL